MMEEVAVINLKDSAEDSEHNSGSPSDINENPSARVTESLGIVLEKSSTPPPGENQVLADKSTNGKRSRTIFDSDSEDNISDKGGNGPKADDSDEDTFDRIKRTKSGFSRIKIQSDSDSDDDDDVKNDNATLVTSELNKEANKISSLIDSESEEDVSQKDDSDPDEQKNVPEKKSRKSKSRKSITTLNKINSDSDSDHDDDDKDDNKSTPVTSSELKQKSTKISSLIDSESEEDTPQRNDPDPEEYPALHENPKQSKSRKSGKSKNMSKRAAKDEALKQIRSETQRMIRESSISLPYHRPKQRTLEDFLNRRKVAPSLPEAPTTKKLKISATILNEVLKEKEEEAEKFYKSSDSEEEHEEQKTDGTVPINPPEAEKISIEDPQKLQKIDLHNRANIINDRSQGVGVSRKLFMDEASPAFPEPSAGIISGKINEEGINMPHKEFERDLEDISIPRKLFNQDSEDGADTLEKNSKVSPLDSGISSTDTQESGSEEIPKPLEVQKSSDDNPETLGDSSKSLKTQISDGKLEDSTVSETPMVRNEESIKLNAKNSISNNSEIINQEIDGDDELDGHVLGLPLSDDEPEELSNKIDSFTPQSSVDPIPTLPSIKKTVLLSMNNIKPKLRGNPGMIIDLNKSSKPDKVAIDNLVDRFLTKHSAVPQTEDKTTEITILNTEITPEGLKISKDTLSYRIRGEKFEDSELNKPGAKLIKLKEELKKKMADKRYEEWKQKEKEIEDDDCDEIDEFEIEEKIIDDDNDDEGESEPEEDDVIIEDKKRKTHDFNDDEAEVSEEDNMELSGDESDNESSGESDADGGDNLDDDHDQEDLADMKSKKFSRIIQSDSDSEEDKTESINKKILERRNTDKDMFADDEIGDYSIGASQSCKTPLGSRKPLSLISPLSESNQIASQMLSASKNHSSNSQMSDFSPLITMSNSPRESSGELENIKSKLFNEETSPIDDEDLLDLCSGKFPNDISTQESVKPNLKGLVDSSPSSGRITESQLMNLCSGSFATQPEAKEDDVVDTHDNIDDFKLTFDDCDVELNKNQESEKIHEEETVINRLDIASSSDDEEEAQKLEEKTKKLMKTKKKVKKLVLSDEEDENTNKNEYSDEESDAEVESEEEKFVDYDSEENEVIIVPKKDLKKVAANYLEEEAELSESEWGSEDEDERDLDNYEMEVADTEDIDESLMRDQIGKIHARQLLDEDNRDVRMLKEMLFDDGDLHEDGEGRERKFRWKNIDKIGLETLVGGTDDDDGVEEEQNDALGEVEWRRLRMEREKFLKEKKKKENEIGGDGELGEGLFGLGLKALKRNSTVEVTSGFKSRTILPRSVPELMQCSSKTSLIVNTVSKRGSFLSRGDASLAIIAGMTKQTEVTLAPVNAGNFLFTHLSPSVSESSEVIERENESSGKSKKIVRKRKSTAGQTPKTMKKAKIDIEYSSAKKLF